MKTGVLGGAFDPPHIAHLTIARAAREQLLLDRVRFIPYALGPHRQEGPVASARDRMEMVRLCVAEHDAFQADERELLRGGVSYTVDTLEELVGEEPGMDLVLIVGADQLETFTTWRSWERILELAEIAVFARPEHTVADLPAEVVGRVRLVDLPPLQVSSTLVRRQVAEGGDIRHLVPPAVARYIEEHRLYSQYARPGNA